MHTGSGEKSPKVSVIMACYNSGNFIGEAINSVIKQHYVNWELIIINDGSTDSTKLEILKFSDVRILYFEQQNKGVSAARNFGLSKMSGEYFCFLDADDIMSVNSIQSRLKPFNKADITFVAGGQEHRDESLQNIFDVQYSTFTGLPKKALLRMENNCFINCGTWLIKRSYNWNYRFPVGWTHCEDLAFFLSISSHGKLESISEIVQIYRRHNRSAMNNLEGLANGYLKFYLLVRNEHHPSPFDLIFLKFRISKIMFLSFLNKGCYKNAFHWSFKILIN